MPRHCSAGGCKSRDNSETRNAGITFHKLPKGESRRNLWITNSHRSDSWDPQTDFVYFCSKHFTPESFELTGCSGIKRLKEDAFPSVFDSLSTTKCKRRKTQQKQEDSPVRESCRSGDQESSRQRSRLSENPTSAAEETPQNKPSSHEPSEAEQLSQQPCIPSPQEESRPPSPSRYMRRLPPPPGFYLSKEHSYAQLSPLLWRRRYNQAIDCLEKALRQLHAARRRENRLRCTVMRLRDKRLKQALLVAQDGCKTRGSWTQGGGRRQEKGGCNQEEGETDAGCGDTEVFEDRCVDQLGLGGDFLPDSSSWSEEEKGYCFYCGRGQVQAGGQVAQAVSKTGEVDENSNENTGENTKDTQTERSPERSVETNDSDVTTSKVPLQTAGFQHVIPAGLSLTDLHELRVQHVGSQQTLLCEGETEAVDPQQHLFVLQSTAEGQLLLLPVPAQDGLQSIFKMDRAADKAQTTLVSELDVKEAVGHEAEKGGDLSRVQTACDGEYTDQHSVPNTTPMEMREDVRKKLKEHLEGFHLQLSTEFLN